MKISTLPHTHIGNTLWGLLLMNEKLSVLFCCSWLLLPSLPTLKKQSAFPLLCGTLCSSHGETLWKTCSEIRGNMFSEADGPDALKRFEWNEMNIWHLSCAYSLSHLGSPISSLILAAAQQGMMTNASLTTQMLLGRVMN